MREIKFRAWVKKQKTMMHPEYIWWENKDFQNREFKLKEISFWETPGSYEKEGNLFEDYEVELMQYTGLKDKNGVEVYEGDIIKAKHDDGRYDVGEVVYGSKGAFCLHLPNVATGIKTPLLNYIHGIMFAESDFEVIGNIYENSELLEAKNDQL